MDSLNFIIEAAPQPASGELEYLLRRAEQESIAAIRSIDPRVAGPHAEMACVYSAHVQSLFNAGSPNSAT